MITMIPTNSRRDAMLCDDDDDDDDNDALISSPAQDAPTRSQMLNYMRPMIPATITIVLRTVDLHASPPTDIPPKS